MFKSNRLSLSAFIFSCLFLFATAFFFSKWTKSGSNAQINWDVAGCYLYLPGFFYDDLGKLNNQQYIIDNYHPSDNWLSNHIGPIGKYVMKYSCGMAILYLPGFAAGHLYAEFAHYPVDGFSYPYQFCMAMYSLMFSCMGLWIARKLLLRYFTDVVVAVTILSLPLATNYLNFAAISCMFVHNYLFTVYVSIIYLTVQWHSKYDYKRAGAIGILCGLAALSRPTDVISILIPLIWGVGSIQSFKERINVFTLEWRKLVVLGGVALVVGSIQLMYWKIYAGKFIYWSYDPQEGLNFLKVHFWSCMFSYKKGWLVYTPFMSLALVGFIPLYRKSKQLFLAIVVFVFIAFYMVFSWNCWWYGGSFSMRAVIQYYALLIFPLAAAFESAFKRKSTGFLAVTFFVFCIWLNLVMTWQANGGDNMETDNMSGKYFWKVFGQIHSNPMNKKFIDTDEEIPGELTPFLTVLSNKTFCLDSNAEHCIQWDGREVFSMNKGVQFAPEMQLDVSHMKNRWFRITCEMNVQHGEPDYTKQPMLYAYLTDSNSQNLKSKTYRVQRIATYSNWAAYSVDIFATEGLNAKYLKGGVYNPDGDVLYLLRRIRVEYVNK